MVNLHRLLLLCSLICWLVGGGGVDLSISKAETLASETDQFWCGCSTCPCQSECGCSKCPCNSYVKPEVVAALPPKCQCASPPCGCETGRTVQSHIPSSCGCSTCPCQPHQLSVRPIVVNSLEDYASSLKGKVEAPKMPKIPPATKPPTPPPTPAPATPAPTPAPTKAPAAPKPKPKPIAKAKKPKKKKKAKKKHAPSNADGADSELKIKEKKKKAKKPKAKPKRVPFADPEEQAQKTIKAQHEALKKRKERAKEEDQKASDKKYKKEVEMKKLEEQLAKIVSGKAPKTIPPMKPPAIDGQLKLDSHQNQLQLGYQDPSFFRRGKFCILAGVSTFSKTDDNPDDQVATLPINCRSSHELIFDTHQTYVTTSRVDASTDGIVRVKAQTSASNSWLSFSSIIIPANYSYDGTKTPDATVLQLNGSWTHYGKGRFGKVSLIVDGDFCALSGVVGGEDVIDWKSDASPILALPKQCHPPNGRLIFLQNHGKHSHRIDILSNGYVRWISGSRDVMWISLNGMIWSAKPDKEGLGELEPRNGWKNWDQGYKRPSYTLQNGLCLVGGVLRNPGGKNDALPAVVLPPACRPAGRLIFATASHQLVSRFDVFDNGQVKLIDVLSAPTIKAGSLLEKSSSTSRSRRRPLSVRKTLSAHFVNVHEHDARPDDFSMLEAASGRRRHRRRWWWWWWHWRWWWLMRMRRQEQVNKWRSEQRSKAHWRQHEQSHKRIAAANENRSKAETAQRQAQESRAKEANGKAVEQGQKAGERATKQKERTAEVLAKGNVEQAQKGYAAQRDLERRNKELLHREKERKSKAENIEKSLVQNRAENAQKTNEANQKSDLARRRSQKSDEQETKRRRQVGDKEREQGLKHRQKEAADRQREKQKRIQMEQDVKNRRKKLQQMQQQAIKLAAEGKGEDSSKLTAKLTSEKKSFTKLERTLHKTLALEKKATDEGKNLRRKAEQTKKSEEAQKRSLKAAQTRRNLEEQRSSVISGLTVQLGQKKELQAVAKQIKLANLELRQLWRSKVAAARQLLLNAKKKWQHSQFHRAKPNSLSAAALALAQKMMRDSIKAAHEENKRFAARQAAARLALQKEIIAAQRDKGRFLEQAAKDRQAAVAARNKEKLDKERIQANIKKVEQKEKSERARATSNQIKTLRDQGKIKEANAAEEALKLSTAKSEKDRKEAVEKAAARELQVKKELQQATGFRPQPVMRAPPQSPEEVDKATQRTAPRPLPTVLISSWHSLEGIRIPVIAKD